MRITRKLFWLLLFLASPGLAWGQGARFDSNATRNVQNFLAPIPGATIQVCTAAATGTPCSPVVPTSPVTLCTDATCSVAAPNPFLADANGNWGFWAIPGTYKVSITATGVTGQLLTVTMPISPSGSIPFTGNNTHSGTETFTGLMQCKNFEGVQCVDSTLSRGGADVLDEIAKAYTAGNGTVWVMPAPTNAGYTASTSITLNDTTRPLDLVFFGKCNMSTGVGNGCINFTPTTAVAAITLDYATSSQNGAHGITGLALINNHCTTSGGCGSLATGIDTGTTNAGTYEGHFDSVSIQGFANAYRNLNGSSVQIHWLHPQINGNLRAMLLKNQSGIVVTGGQIAGNNTGFVANDSSSSFELILNGLVTFANSLVYDCTAIVSVANACGIVANGTHWETNVVGAGPGLGNGIANVQLNGGGVESDNVGTLTSMFSLTNGYIASSPTTIWSSGGTVTQIVSAGSNARGELHGLIRGGTFTNIATGSTHFTTCVFPGYGSVAATSCTFESPFASPIINGTPTGTGIATTTLKKGSGTGNYTTASTSFAVVDSTNLCYTVTIPTGWKLGIQASGSLGTSTAVVQALVAITDNAACSTAGGVLVQNQVFGNAAGNAEPFSLSWIITGDGNSHNVALQFATTNAADSALLINSSSTLLPTMVFTLVPSN